MAAPGIIQEITLRDGTRAFARVERVAENYAVEGGGIASIGVRFLGRRLSADLGLATPLGANEFFVFPMVNVVWTF